MARPAVRRQEVAYAVDRYRLFTRRACKIVREHRSGYYYRSCEDPKVALRGRMRELAQIRIRYGYRRLHVLVKRADWALGKE
jgi:putative transposase